MENKTKNVMVYARIKESQRDQLMRVAVAKAPEGEKPNISVVVREAIIKYLRGLGYS